MVPGLFCINPDKPGDKPSLKLKQLKVPEVDLL